MEMHAVTSSNIAQIGYDSSTGTVRVVFNDGSVYEYYNVEKHVFDDFLTASSVGKYLHQHLKGKYQYSRI